jgi:hypothetical protein
MALANFGQPKYGASLVGRLVYPSADPAFHQRSYDCDPQKRGLPSCNFACRPLNESSPAFEVERQPGRHTVLLLDRGPRANKAHAAADGARPCYFVDKAYHAQLAGADAVLVVNDEPGDDLSTAVAPEDEATGRELAALSISAGLVTQRDGQRLKDMLRQGPVAVALNWTDAFPKAERVSWEFWTNSNDECGLSCDQQRAFVRRFKGAAKALEQRGTVRFEPHYLIWVCQFGADSPECRSQCIRGGAYCCPDPDDDLQRGYSGADVLLMNLRALCARRTAEERLGKGWLWWDYVDRLGLECPMRDGRYTPECAEKAFRATVGAEGGGGGGADADGLVREWHACSDVPDPAAKGKPHPLLDAELQAQVGKGGEDGKAGSDAEDGPTTVAILPTVRVNGKQYRGALEPGPVLRAVCAGFAAGTEPAVCNERWVSDDECAPGGEGDLACRSSFNATAGRTRCVNTFSGYQCECGQGFMRVQDAATGEETCAELNECVASQVWRSKPECACDRCACVNTVGGYNCTGALPDYCTPERKFGGCWTGEGKGGKPVHACVDALDQYRWLGERGRVRDSDRPYRCRCPKCFRAVAGSGDDGFQCEPACDLSTCDEATGQCAGGVAEAAAGRGARGGGGGGGGGGLGFGGALMLVSVSVGLTSAVGYAAYHAYVRRAVADDVRAILEEYVPLASAPANRPGGGGSNGGNGGGIGGGSGGGVFGGLMMGGGGGRTGGSSGSAFDDGRDDMFFASLAPRRYRQSDDVGGGAGCAGYDRPRKGGEDEGGDDGDEGGSGGKKPAAAPAAGGRRDVQMLALAETSD